MDEYQNEELFVETLLEIPYIADDEADAMYLLFLQDLFDRGIIAGIHCYCMQFQYALWGYEWIDNDQRAA